MKTLLVFISIIVILILSYFFIKLFSSTSIYETFPIISAGYVFPNDLNKQSFKQPTKKEICYYLNLNDKINNKYDETLKKAFFFFFNDIKGLDIKGYVPGKIPYFNIRKRISKVSKNSKKINGGNEIIFRKIPFNDFYEIIRKKYKPKFFNESCFIPDFVIKINDKYLIFEFDENNYFHQEITNINYVAKNLIYDQLINESNIKGVSLAIVRITYNKGIFNRFNKYISLKNIIQRIFFILSDYENISSGYILMRIYNNKNNIQVNDFSKLEINNKVNITFNEKEQIFFNNNLNNIIVSDKIITKNLDKSFINFDKTNINKICVEKLNNLKHFTDDDDVVKNIDKFINVFNE